jgi:flagellar secretion chaperone FliS
MRGYGSYKASSTKNAPKYQVVTMLFQEAVKRLNRAASSEKTDATWLGDLHHCREIFLELSNGLDPSAAPELCQHLAPLYSWCIDELIAAGVENSPERAKNVLRVTRTLLDGWTSALKQPQKVPA